MLKSPNLLSKLLFSSRAPLFLLIATLALWLFIPSLFKSFFKANFHEFQAPMWMAQSYLKEVQSNWIKRSRSKNELIEAASVLARQNAAYALHYDDHQVIREEVERLRDFFNLPPPPGYRYAVARVIRREINAWWQQLTLDKGANYNIPEGAAVVFSGGVVGRVTEVRTYTSIVELISSPNFRMVARLEKDSRPVTYQGVGARTFKPPLGRVSTVQRDVIIPLNKSRRLISAGWGGIFPEGIPIGRVKQLEPSSDDLFQSGQVLLDERLLSLREVAVIIPIAENDLKAKQ